MILMLNSSSTDTPAQDVATVVAAIHGHGQASDDAPPIAAMARSLASSGVELRCDAQVFHTLHSAGFTYRHYRCVARSLDLWERMIGSAKQLRAQGIGAEVAGISLLVAAAWAGVWILRLPEIV